MAAPKMSPPPAPPSKPTPPTDDSKVRALVPPSDQISTRESFELAQRIASAWAAATIVPDAYKNNIANCLIAVEIAARLGMSPLQVMQSLDVIVGRPAWRSQFIVALVNTSGRFKGSLCFRMKGEGMTRSCVAFAVDKHTNEIVEGPEVNMEMAKAEGWLDRTGSKWKTMPDLMLRYRAGAFFGRLYVPERLLGSQSVE